GNASLFPAIGSAYSPAVGDSFTIIDKSSPGPVTGVFNGLPEGGSFIEGGARFRVTYAGGDGNDVVMRVEATGVQPAVTVDDVRVVEGDAGDRPATFTVALSEPVMDNLVYVDYATVDGTA